MHEKALGTLPLSGLLRKKGPPLLAGLGWKAQ